MSRIQSTTSSSRGFTLLEILVVIAILAIAAGAIVATLDRDERGTLEREARRFAGALEYAALRAQLRHESIGVSALGGGDRNEWRFWARARDGRWQAIEDDPPLAMHALPAQMTLAATSYGGRALPADAVVPLRPSGRNEPYAFALASASFEARVRADPLNRVAIDGPVAR